jgi:CRP-like cAMP-binding protein
MIDIHLMKLRARSHLSAEEETEIRSLAAEIVEVPADRTVIPEGKELSNSTLLLSGWMARAKDLPSGPRQITDLHVAGDFVDLHGFTLKRLDHDIISLSLCRIAIVPHERLKRMTERFPHLTRIYWFMTNMDAATHREWTLSIGRRSAIGRMAHLFCEMNIRLGLVGLSPDNSYEFPLTQVELGECLGLTSVHVNRTLQELRRRGLMDLQNRRVTIHQLEALKGVAEFDPTYLYLDRDTPR